MPFSSLSKAAVPNSEAPGLIELTSQSAHSQLLGEHPRDTYLRVYLLLLLAIPRAPPVTQASSQPSTSAEPRMAIPISEYRELCRSLETLTASQSSLAHEMAAIRHAKSRCWPPKLSTLHLKAAPTSFRSATSC
ncbi:hypothetical protein CK203_045194 [Vitis vinifera]|uniref:Uncharacterized protein n=1 Tax=Vitis vinifera TaxID=29760 RepID=A0A438H4K3_VITVI|nr:hypothetical protein CK203_045194 [Vitis vinifera]